MFSIFNKREAVNSGKRRPSGHPAVLASRAPKPVDHEDPTVSLDIPVDEAMRIIDSGLSSLSHLEVGQAAKERGWATLHRELERHPVRPAVSLRKGSGATSTTRPGSLEPVAAGRGPSRGRRIALSSAGVAVAIMAILVGTYAAGLLGTGDGGPVAVVTTQITIVTSTESTEATTPTSAVTTEVTATTEAPVTTDTTPVTGITTSTDTTSGTTDVTGGPTTPTTRPATLTTKPTSPPTTSPQQMASAERERDAKVMAADLAGAVIDYFLYDDDISQVLRRVAPSAQSSLRQMIGALEDPTSGQVVPGSAKLLNSDANGDTVRLTLEFVDLNDSPRFFITVRVTDQGATITAISAAS
jgi:hypothetical protein